MPREISRNDNHRPRTISRRDFLTLAAAGLLAGCCGLTCTDCPAFLATQADDDAAKKAIAAGWSAHYGMEFKPEDINCDGCLSEGGQLSGYCRNICQVRPCAQEREVENCVYCDDYACEKLSDFLAQVPQAKATLERIRKSIGQ